MVTQERRGDVAFPPESGGDVFDRIEVQAAVLVRNFELLRRRADAYGDLDRSGYLLLRALAALGASDINTLACALGLDPSTAGRQVSTMERDGLVHRTRGAEDRRRSVVEATEEGRRAMERTGRRRREGAADLLTDWDEQDLQTLATMFARYNEAVADRFLVGRSAVAR